MVIFQLQFDDQKLARRLDVGDVKGLDSLQLFKEIFRALENRGHGCSFMSLFDIVGGTSTGVYVRPNKFNSDGANDVHYLIAIMLDRLRMTVNEAIEALQWLSPKMFTKIWWAQSQASKHTKARLKHHWFEGKI